MFKKDMEAGPSGTRPHEDKHSSAPAPAAAGSRRSAGSGQGAVIGRSIKIKGDVKGDEDLLIEGDVSGTVELKNNSVTIGAEGKVQANIYARVINVEGSTEGDLYASEMISVRASANMHGNLVAPRIALEDGARFKGSVDMDSQSVEKALGSQSRTNARSEPAAAPKTIGDAKPAVSQAGV
jgi:cytoskeletal protein CcmA (bactofilin family)